MPVEVARGAGQDDCVRALDASTNLSSQKAEGVSYQWLVDDSACAAEDGEMTIAFAVANSKPPAGVSFYVLLMPK